MSSKELKKGRVSLEMMLSVYSRRIAKELQFRTKKSAPVPHIPQCTLAIRRRGRGEFTLSCQGVRIFIMRNIHLSTALGVRCDRRRARLVRRLVFIELDSLHARASSGGSVCIRGRGRNRGDQRNRRFLSNNPCQEVERGAHCGVPLGRAGFSQRKGRRGRALLEDEAGHVLTCCLTAT